jgi:hypothetical protein
MRTLLVRAHSKAGIHGSRDIMEVVVVGQRACTTLLDLLRALRRVNQLMSMHVLVVMLPI